MITLLVLMMAFIGTVRSDCALSCQDPHLTLAHGGKTDFRGKNNTIYNFLTAQNVSLNIKTELADFKLGELTVHGSFMTEIHLVVGSAGRFLNMTYWGSELNKWGWGWRMINGTCSTPDALTKFRMYPHTSRFCNGASIGIKMSTVIVETREWRFIISNKPVYNRLSGPLHRLDLGIEQKVSDAEFAVSPHGIIGQSFDGDSIPRIGKLDDYPSRSNATEFTTSAMAEGAIEGTAADYEVASGYETRCKYSRFNWTSSARASLTKPSGALHISRISDFDDDDEVPRRLSEESF